MNKSFVRRIGALCTGAVMTASALMSMSSSLTVTAAGSDDYAKILQYSLYFYDANMCGNDVQSKCALDWRGNCHTSDDVPGGYHDAGDPPTRAP